MRQIPTALQLHLNQAATTTTRLLKVTLKNGFVYGLSMLDRDIAYDDGLGEVLYVATNGFDSSTLATDLGYSVGNAEGYALISNSIDGLELEDIEAGALNDAEWVCYLVNFENLESGQHLILDAGDIGEVKVQHGVVWLPELMSYIQRLKQPVGSVWSRTCRAIFGTPASSQTGCGIQLETLWVEGEVQTVGPETNRVFTGDQVREDSPGPPLVPGRVQFLTGANAGQEFATEELDGLTVTLAETTNYPIEAGDTYRIRPDCGKRFLEDCKGTWNNAVNFKGEYLIPVGDATAVQAPGAQLGAGWRYQAPTSEDEG